MDKQFARLLELGKRGAERSVGALINEVSVLSTSFPHLADAFDADELPVSFILKRDSRGAQIEVVGRHRSGWAAGHDTVHQANQEGRQEPSSNRLTRGNERHFEGRERD